LESIKESFRELIEESSELQAARVEAIKTYQTEMTQSIELLAKIQSRDKVANPDS